jgi:hypothetical protein
MDNRYIVTLELSNTLIMSVFLPEDIAICNVVDEIKNVIANSDDPRIIQAGNVWLKNIKRGL